MDNVDESTLSHLNKIISNRLTSGVVILDESGEILYLNQEALSILSTFSANDDQSDNNPATPINKAIIEAIKENLGPLNKPSSSIIQCSNTDSTYSLRALPLDKLHKKGKSCVMVLIEGVTIHRKFDMDVVQKQFGLTKREAEVTFCLTKGLTNKEIANILSLSPETVHDYVKQVMKKFKTTTRAGIVGKVLP
ncbi:MAG: LuxR C-terminal-related transcriptional regulator [Nitrospirota bacterium]